MTENRPSIDSVAATLLEALGAPAALLDAGAAPSDRRVLGDCPAPLKKLLVFCPDALGEVFFKENPDLLAAVRAAAPLGVRLRSALPPKTPVCFASMFSGLPPEGHGIRKYEKPVLACRTVFDALPEFGLSVAVAAVAGSSVDTIFKGRRADYFSEPDDLAVTARGLELIAAGRHDVIVAYQQAYDDALHAGDLRGAPALAAARGHAADFCKLAAAFRARWAGLPRGVLFAPDHGAHFDPAARTGAHGEDIPEDMDVLHFWGFGG